MCTQAVKFVFVSACNSEMAGRALVRAGVPHVIAVDVTKQVRAAFGLVFVFQMAFCLEYSLQTALPRCS